MLIVRTDFIYIYIIFLHLLLEISKFLNVFDAVALMNVLLYGHLLSEQFRVHGMGHSDGEPAE